MLYRLLRPLLFALPPEAAHSLSLRAVAALGALPGRGGAAPVELLGLRFPNRVGLAAGYDKDAVGWRGLARLGFGHVEVGTVTPRPQPGNPPPRVFRLADDGSLINRLGFPSAGAEAVLRRLGRRRPGDPVLGVNVGKQRDTPLERAADDYVALVRRFAARADYLAVNISSPNTPDLRRLQRGDWLCGLLRALSAAKVEREQALSRAVPLLVKLSPDLDDEALDRAVDAIAASAVDGVIATNTTVARSGLRSAAAGETGGLSGRALTERATAVVARIHARAGERLPIIACGGVMDERDALDKRRAGASLVQLYTGLVYGGPGLPARVARVLEGVSAA